MKKLNLIVLCFGIIFYIHSCNKDINNQVLSSKPNTVFDIDQASVYDEKDILNSIISIVGPDDPDKFSIEFIKQESDTLITKWSGITDLLIEISGDSNKKLIVYGNIEYIIMEQYFLDGKISGGYLKEIKGDFIIEELNGLSYSGMLALLGDEDPRECRTDEECEEAYPPKAAFHLECINGSCHYIQNN